MSGKESEKRICTLTGKDDRKDGEKTQINPDTPFLNKDELKIAVQELHVNLPYPQVERRYLDPPLDGQKFGLFSFVPAVGVKPNQNGIYGFAKLRGNFSKDTDAKERAEMIIREVDSYHKIYTPIVGYPFPVTTKSGFAEDVTDVDVKRDMKESMSEAVKRKRQEDEKEIEEIQQKEKNLLDDVKKAPEENKEDYYTTLMTKKAQLTWTYVETMKKMRQVAILAVKARKEVEDLDKQNSSLKEQYMKKYMDARRQAGIPDAQINSDDNFIKYMVEDVRIPEFESEYQRLFGEEQTVEVVVDQLKTT